MSSTTCSRCSKLRQELDLVEQRAQTLEADLSRLRHQLQEAAKLIELQQADLDRYRDDAVRNQPNTPERAPSEQLQLAFERLMGDLGHLPPAKEMVDRIANDQEADRSEEAPAGRSEKRQSPHSRRRLDLTTLPVEEILIDPDEVVAAGGEGYERIGEVVSDRVAFRRGGYVRLRVVRGTWVKKRAPKESEPSADSACRLSTAELPESIWPGYMADPSAVAEVIVSKYEDLLPLHRQERISRRHGFMVPRSTQCGWLSEASALTRRIVLAMRKESIERAFCIATDATGARVRAPGRCQGWNLFVMIADRDHVVFEYAKNQNYDTVGDLLLGFRGYHLADAAPVHNILYQSGEVIEVGCWYHRTRSAEYVGFCG